MFKRQSGRKHLRCKSQSVSVEVLQRGSEEDAVDRKWHPIPSDKLRMAKKSGAVQFLDEAAKTHEEQNSAQSRTARRGQNRRFPVRFQYSLVSRHCGILRPGQHFFVRL